MVAVTCISASAKRAFVTNEFGIVNVADLPRERFQGRGPPVGRHRSARLFRDSREHRDPRSWGGDGHHTHTRARERFTSHSTGVSSGSRLRSPCCRRATSSGSGPIPFGASTTGAKGSDLAHGRSFTQWNRRGIRRVADARRRGGRSDRLGGIIVADRSSQGYRSPVSLDSGSRNSESLRRSLSRRVRRGISWTWWPVDPQNVVRAP